METQLQAASKTQGYSAPRSVKRDHPAGTIEFHFSWQQSATQKGENERKEMSAPTKEEDYSK